MSGSTFARDGRLPRDTPAPLLASHMPPVFSRGVYFPPAGARESGHADGSSEMPRDTLFRGPCAVSLRKLGLSMRITARGVPSFYSDIFVDSCGWCVLCRFQGSSQDKLNVGFSPFCPGVGKKVVIAFALILLLLYRTGGRKMNHPKRINSVEEE